MTIPRSGPSLPCAARNRLARGKIAFVPGVPKSAPSLPGRLKVAILLDRNMDFVGEQEDAADGLEPAHAAKHRAGEDAEVGMNLPRRRSVQISVATRVFPLCDPRPAITANNKVGSQADSMAR
jgi:hypothetical protein